jgi:hypothetical protein
MSRKQSANESFIVSADLLVARGQTGAIEILRNGQGEGKVLHIPFLDPQDADAHLSQHILKLGNELAEGVPLCDEVFIEMLSGELAGSVENAIRRFYTMLPDDHISERELHQAVDGDMRRKTKIGSPGIDLPKHGPFKHRFRSIFFEHL